ncbi:hypothetical protein RhiJN_21472 [Ceratobasidium sp. AG-Ba]|nr:hypothetical protein RhiJN_21472 [Ceratobasidium sp. AG-Ba]
MIVYSPVQPVNMVAEEDLVDLTELVLANSQEVQQNSAQDPENPVFDPSLVILAAAIHSEIIASATDVGNTAEPGPGPVPIIPPEEPPAPTSPLGTDDSVVWSPLGGSLNGLNQVGIEEGEVENDYWED